MSAVIGDLHKYETSKMDPVEPVSPLPALTEACQPKCTGQYASYQSCVDRITKKGQGECEPWFFDYMKCIDKCRVPSVFKDSK
jgi:ubiquinol-cytochrome c reductase subunit 6